MLHIVTGPMFSGKTSYLSAHLPPKSLYINHCLDTRGELFYSHNASLTFLEYITCIKTDKLSDDLVEGFDRTVGEADVRAVFVYARPLNQPWLRFPAGCDAGFRWKHGGHIVNLRTLLGGDALPGEHRVERWALPLLFGNVVGNQHIQPEILPRLLFIGRRALGPDVFMVLQVGV